MSSILGPKGMPMVEFGGSRAWRQYVKRDVVASFQWIDIGHESGEAQPCMCLFPTERRMNGGVYVIPAENAHLYADNKGHPTPFGIGAGFKAAVQLGFFPDRSTVKRITDIIVDCLDDLRKMPTGQPSALDLKRQTMGVEVQVKHGDAVIHEALH